MRDDFSAKTVRTLAARAGYHCSNPECVRSTAGPALDESKIVNIGVGAHIKAASVGGKRYDPTMRPAERRSVANGIWMCQSCSKLIDSDEKRYTVQLLHQWKADATARAHASIASGAPLGPVKPSPVLDSADEEFLRGLYLPSSDAVDTVAERLRAATQSDIEGFRTARDAPVHTIVLTLRLEGAASPLVTLENVARLAQLAEPISIVAPGGTGKSTTLLQLAELMSEGDGPIPLMVPLGAWSDREEDFFDFILRRGPFSAFRRQHFMQLAYHGRLVLLLDGWNELTPEARLRATNDLTGLQRDYPQLALVISSRRQGIAAAGHIVTIEELSLDQQMELAQAIGGHDGVQLVDRAWRSAGVRDLVAIPLYLSALLKLPNGAPFPDTKEAVLRMFVQQNEATPEKVERLERDTLGRHTVVLTGLAGEANRSANTVISDSNANRTISSIFQHLSEQGEILLSSAPQPRAVVNGLVAAHLLVREAGASGALRFQHQLFQEWYAAAEVENVMLKAASGNASARKRLREEILDKPNWEESILFACDRLSRTDAEGVHAVAIAIEDTLTIDPLLAAAMIDRATEAVWHGVRERAMNFIQRWHRPGAVDRAVSFMVTSGKADFADMFWPLASSGDDQIQFRALRAADYFRTSVLGADRENRLTSLPREQRKIALHEIASHSGFEGMELATTLVMSDPDPDVVVSVVEALSFRRGDRHVKRMRISLEPAQLAGR